MVCTLVRVNWGGGLAGWGVGGGGHCHKVVARRKCTLSMT